MSKLSILEIGMVYTLHEIKNPLTSIILTLELLESGDVENHREYYGILKRNATAISKSIHELCICYEEKLLDDPVAQDAFSKNALGPGTNT